MDNENNTPVTGENIPAEDMGKVSDTEPIPQENVQTDIRDNVQTGMPENVQAGVQENVQQAGMQESVQTGMQESVQAGIGMRENVQQGVQGVQTGVQGSVQPGVQPDMPQQQRIPYPDGAAFPQMDQPVKKKFSGGCLWVLIIAVMLMFMVIVMAAAAIALRGNTDSKGGTDESPKETVFYDRSEHVTVNIPKVQKPVLEEEFYQNSETGLLTPVGVAKTILPSQVKISIFGDMPYTPISSGSGFILTADGYIVTNAHVVDGAKQIAVKLYDGTEEKAKFIGLDKKSDLAVIKINRTDLAPAEIGMSSGLVIGEEVALAGAGGGFANTVTYGHVTGLDREIDTDYISSTAIRCIQSDAALNPGNSGGALVNMYGQVVGVAVALMNHEKYENIGFCIAIDDAVPIAEELIANGYVSSRARVGVTFVSVGDDFAKTYKVTPGLCVMDVDPTCDVANAGLEAYDIITHIDDMRVYGTEEIIAVLAGKLPGDEITLTVFRKEITGEPVIFKVTAALAPDTSSMSGYSLENNDEDYFSRDIIK